MSGMDRSRADHIRALLDEADRVRGESERVSGQIDRHMKQPFWPERRRSVRLPESTPDDHGSDAR